MQPVNIHTYCRAATFDSTCSRCTSGATNFTAGPRRRRRPRPGQRPCRIASRTSSEQLPPATSRRPCRGRGLHGSENAAQRQVAKEVRRGSARGPRSRRTARGNPRAPTTRSSRRGASSCRCSARSSCSGRSNALARDLNRYDQAARATMLATLVDIAERRRVQGGARRSTDELLRSTTSKPRALELQAGGPRGSPSATLLQRARGEQHRRYRRPSRGRSAAGTI
jgi:hypothetical protein